MNKRILAIVAAFAVPVVAIASVAYLGSKDKKPSVPNTTLNAIGNKPIPSLEEVRGHIKARLAELNAMTPAQWEAQQKKGQSIPVSLKQMRDNTQKTLERLEATTQEQWEKQQLQTRQRMAQQNQLAGQDQPMMMTPVSTPKANATNLQSDPYYPPSASFPKE